MSHARLSQLCQAYAGTHDLRLTEDRSNDLLTLSFGEDLFLMLHSDRDHPVVTIYSSPGYAQVAGSEALGHIPAAIDEEPEGDDEKEDDWDDEWDLDPFAPPQALPRTRRHWHVQISPDSRMLVLSHESDFDDLSEHAFAALVNRFVAMHRLFADALSAERQDAAPASFA
ncbi:MAG: hypothetical protein KF871_08250 [Hydrogenophaga sp.]|uniref:hypothetical protein n=1 Tax=Hydrogenophaga sp. TaxID=1904254 RepID=UPI001E15037D|nr:hypothetical protein [Hydrogenophaga sp.]MBX3609877.1 hypothetical protein [Hydrogenophaga sp.]